MKNMKKIILIFTFLISGFIAQCQELKWHTDVSVASDLSIKENKPMFLFFTGSDWCGWCKKMDKGTFSDSTVAAYMNENFYCVKFNAESKDTIHYNNNIFYYIPEYKSHALAVSLLDGKMSYPSYIVLTEKEQRLKIMNGYQEVDVFLQNLKILANFKAN